MFKQLLNIFKNNNQNQIKIEMFDFEKDWSLVEPHLGNPKLVKLLNKAMHKFSIRHKPIDLPIWDSTDDIGPWEYGGRPNIHEQHAVRKASAEEEALIEEYKQICEKENLEFEEIVSKAEHEDPKKDEIAEAFFVKYFRIVEKYFPQKNTYPWYQCYTAGSYLKKWQLALAKKIFPDYKWRTYEGHDAKSRMCTIAHIGKGPNGNYLVFDIFTFKKGSVDEILKSVGFNRDNLKGGWVFGKTRRRPLKLVHSC
jgi:hypothetical protein